MREPDPQPELPLPVSEAGAVVEAALVPVWVPFCEWSGQVPAPVVAESPLVRQKPKSVPKVSTGHFLPVGPPKIEKIRPKQPHWQVGVKPPPQKCPLGHFLDTIRVAVSCVPHACSCARVLVVLELRAWTAYQPVHL